MTKSWHLAYCYRRAVPGGGSARSLPRDIDIRTTASLSRVGSVTGEWLSEVGPDGNWTWWFTSTRPETTFSKSPQVHVPGFVSYSLDNRDILNILHLRHILLLLHTVLTHCPAAVVCGVWGTGPLITGSWARLWPTSLERPNVHGIKRHIHISTTCHWLQPQPCSLTTWT